MSQSEQYLNVPFIKAGETASFANTQMTGNYASAAQKFEIRPTTDEVYVLTRMLVAARDTGNFDAAAYGNAITLTNGITLQVENDSGVVNQIIPTYGAVKTNAQWGVYCYDVDVKTWGVGDQVMLVRWTFSKGQKNITLSGRRNERLVITLNDDFTGLNAHAATCQGYKFTVQ